jgi:alpha-amylase
VSPEVRRPASLHALALLHLARPAAPGPSPTYPSRPGGPPQGYLPAQLYQLQSSYGSEQQLRQLLAALKQAGISPLADIVINHRSLWPTGPPAEQGSCSSAGGGGGLREAG